MVALAIAFLLVMLGGGVLLSVPVQALMFRHGVRRLPIHLLAAAASTFIFTFVALTANRARIDESMVGGVRYVSAGRITLAGYLDNAAVAARFCILGVVFGTITWAILKYLERGRDPSGELPQNGD